MFHDIAPEMMQRMRYLEDIDARDRSDGTPRLRRLRQIPPDTGKFIALIASACPAGECIEIGTSAGYSTMWLSLAAREKNVKIKTYEVLPEKAAMARETFARAGIGDRVELVEGDFLKLGSTLGGIAFCFLDAEKEIYGQCFDIVADKMVRNGFIVADNAINHYEKIRPMIEKAREDSRFDCLTVPLGNGEFLCRRK